MFVKECLLYIKLGFRVSSKAFFGSLPAACFASVWYRIHNYQHSSNYFLALTTCSEGERTNLRHLQCFNLLLKSQLASLSTHEAQYYTIFVTYIASNPYYTINEDLPRSFHF